MPTLNVVPRDSVSFERFDELATGYGWQLDQDSVAAARIADASPEWSWTVDGGTVTLVQDSALKRPFLIVDADDPQPIADRITRDVPCFTLPEIVETVTSASTPEERISALRLLGAAAPAQIDQTIVDAIQDNAARSEPRVRLAAVSASSRLRWPVLRPVVAQVSESDESEALRAGSSNILGLTRWDRG
ncbi:HEAT repeat domain-containing protein [Actinoplanes sp. NPDC051470]|uniref:HEAT repeat domain-containing protein n=1 Tax=unclassified Actinoplanes TaxID=2626549 RepID=UPI00343AE44F